MPDEPKDVSRTAVATLSRPVLPPMAPVSPEEIARRRALFAKFMALREQIGPIGVRTDDLIHLTRTEADATDE